MYRLPTGKWRREPVGASYALAKEVEAQRKAEVSTGKYFPERIADKKSFQSISDQYFELHGSSLRSKSWRLMSKHINRHFGAKPIYNITSQDIQTFYNQLESAISITTANRYLTLIRAIFNKAKTWGNFHSDNPCSAVKNKQEPHHRLRYLSTDEMKALIANSPARLFPVVACALMTGMRRSEILNLEWQDIDFTSDTIQIMKSKSGKMRKIPIMPKLRQILIDLPAKPSGNVFNMPNITLRRHFALALEASRIHYFRFHDLRHTFASHFAMTTQDLPTLQQILGHASIQMTLRYAHLSDKHISEKMTLLSNALPIERCTTPSAIAPLIAPPQFSAPQNLLESPIEMPT